MLASLSSLDSLSAWLECENAKALAVQNDLPPPKHTLPNWETVQCTVQTILSPLNNFSATARLALIKEVLITMLLKRHEQLML